MKYRCLTDKELKELEHEFKQFLILNNVYNEEWVKLNKNKDKKVLHLVEKFSDIVMEKALQKISFLEHIDPTGIKVFYCKKDEIALIGINTANKKIDFKTYNFEANNKDLTIFKVNKKYIKQREQEIFELLNSGCAIIKEEKYHKFELVYTYSTKKSKN